MAAQSSEKTFSASKLAKLVSVSIDRIRIWHRKGFISGVKRSGRLYFGFQDLIAARAANRLICCGLTLKQVTTALTELRKNTDNGDNPLVRFQLESLNGQIVMNEGCHLIDVSSGQLHLDIFANAQNRKGVVGSPDDFRRDVKGGIRESSEGYLAAAVAAELNQEWQRAAQAYRGMIRFEPQNVTAIVNLGNCHYQLGEFGVAVEVYRAALQVASDCHEAWYNLANVLDEMHKFEEAVSAFKTALALAPSRFEIHYNLALTFEKMSARSAAKEHWQAVVALSNDPEAIKMATLFLESYTALDL